MTSSAAMEWISMRFISSPTRPRSIRSVTNWMVRISRINDELNEISLTRLRISRALRGTSAGRPG
jgi:hypothetical protein